MKKAIIIGASSGIGKELAKILSRRGWSLGLTARRTELLEKLKSELPGPALVKFMDVAKPETAIPIFQELAQEMGGLDLAIINAGTGFLNPELEWSKEQATIAVNVSGFAALAGSAMQYFIRQKSGHLVGISSIAELRGSDICPAYNASKAFVSNYLEGLRKKAAKAKLEITVTDIRPGLVDTAMAQGEGLFWVASPQKAAEQIYRAIRQKKSRAYVTKRWGLVAGLLQIMPDFLYNKI